MPRRTLLAVAAALTAACTPTNSATDSDSAPSPPEPPTDASAGSPDAGEASDGGVFDGGPAPGPFDPGPEPDAPLEPLPGELTMYQLKLTGFLRLGEAAVIVGPDGSLTLLDLGGRSHAGVVREFVRDLNTRALTPDRGYSRVRGPLEVDWIIITHWHADHSGAYRELMSGPDALDVTQGVVHRGFTDLGSGITESNFEAACESLRGRHAGLGLPACSSEEQAPCDVDSARERFPAVRCDGLFLGDALSPSDDDQGAPTYLPIGGDARITLMGASNHASDGRRAVPGPTVGYDDNGNENARSLLGVVTHGPFHYHFGGDLTGRGDAADPDVESHVAEVATPVFYGPLGVDVTHVHHHARRDSSNAAFVDAVAPIDGLSRNAVAGISEGHVGSPHSQVLSRWLDDDRLADGRFWATQTEGADHPAFIAADGLVVLQTRQGGRGYWLQAAGTTFESRPYQSVRDARR